MDELMNSIRNEGGICQRSEHRMTQDVTKQLRTSHSKLLTVYMWSCSESFLIGFFLPGSFSKYYS